MHCGDVRHHRRDGVIVSAAIEVILCEVRHDGELPRVVRKNVAGAVGGTAVVRALVAETERVADLVNIGLEAVTIYSRATVVGSAVFGDPIRADIDSGRHHLPVRKPATAGACRHRSIVVEVDVGGTGGQNERNVGDLLPKIERRCSQRLLRRGQIAEIVGDRIAEPMVGNGALSLPITVDKIICELGDSPDRLAGVEGPALKSAGAEVEVRAGPGNLNSAISGVSA